VECRWCCEEGRLHLSPLLKVQIIARQGRAGMTGASPVTTIYEQSPSSVVLGVRSLTGTLSGGQVIMPYLSCFEVTLAYVNATK
jgi:hypothetical protein